MASDLGAEKYISVLLAEEEPDTISLITLFLSEIKEVQLTVASSAEETLLKLEDTPASLVLFSDGLPGKNSLHTIQQIHDELPSTYVIVSLDSPDHQRFSHFMSAGANDCVARNKQYIPTLVQAIKKGLSRIAERKSFSISPMPRADQFIVDENLPDIVFYLNGSGKILYANRVVQDLLGIDQKRVVHSGFEDLIQRPEQQKLFREYLSGRDSHPGLRRIFTLGSNAEEAQNFEMNFALREGDVIYVVARPLPRDADHTPVFNGRPSVEKSLELPVRIGPYRVLALLGAGSMGRVYKGFDEQLERYVAIKVVGKKLAATQDYLERFHKEAKLLATLTHPNIALIYFFGTLEGLPYFCMEYMAGGSLENLLRTEKQISHEKAVSYTMQIAIGLSKALEKGIVHLDIKPSNLMIAENDRIKIVDFGLARTTSQLQSISSHIIGTPLYVAPEQIRGGIVDFRCDIFSLGITFFQMMYGFVPHAASKVQEVFRRRLKEGLPEYDQLEPKVPRRLYEMVNRMTHSNPAERYPTYADVIADLEAARRGKMQQQVQVELSPPAGSAVYMRGLLYDRSFAEVLGHIASKKLSGKLTLSWFDICKNVHFKNGEIIAVISNQEGEGFLDLLLKHNQIGAERARQFEAASSDLFTNYSSAMNELTQEAKQKISREMLDLAWHILQGLFSWVVGEFLFEEGDFPAQSAVQIRTGEILSVGVRSWMDFPTIHRRLYGGRCRIKLNPGFQETLPVLSVGPADAFILFRFEKSISFRELQDISAISEDEFFRLIFLFFCVDILQIEEITTDSSPRPARKPDSAKHGQIKQQAITTERTEIQSPVPPASPRPIPEDPVSLKKEPEPVLPIANIPQIKDLAHYYYQCAVHSFESKNYWAAVEYCKKALDLKKEARIYRLMGNSLATHQAFYHEAMDAYKKGLEQDPNSYGIERDIADLYFVTGNYALARSRYLNVAKKNPEDQHSQDRLKEIARLKK